MNISWRYFISVLTLALVGCATTGPDSVERAKNVNESIPLRVSDAASVFIVEMVDARLMDYEEGKLAADRGTQLAIREYGEWMMRDQSVLLKQLNRLAAASRVTVPIVIGADKRDGLKDLLALEGESFDKAFMRSIRIDHKRDVEKFKQATQLPDVSVAAFAAEKLPLIESHLEAIERIAREY